MQDDLEDVIQRFREGDIRAFEQIYYLHHKKIYAFCVKNGQPREDAEEVVQEVFLKLWMKKKDIDPTRNLQSYVFAIAKNVIIDKFKKLVRQKAADEYQLHLLTPVNSTEDEVLYNDLQEKIREVFDSLPEMRKLVFQMSRLRGFSNREIAAELGISIRTVEHHISHALQSFRDKFGQSSALVLLLYVFSYLECYSLC